MKKFVLFFAFLFVATLNAGNWSGFYHIDGDTLVSAQGKRFPALDFGSACIPGFRSTKNAPYF